MQQNTYSQQTAKFIATVAQNMPDLPADAMQYWINQPKKLQDKIRKAFLPDFPTWKTIKIGQRGDAHELRRELALHGVAFEVGGCGFEKMLKSEGLSLMIREVELILVNTDCDDYRHMRGSSVNKLFQALGYESLTAEMAAELAIACSSLPIIEVPDNLIGFSPSAWDDDRQLAYYLNKGWSPGYAERQLELSTFISTEPCGKYSVIFAKPLR